MNHLLRAALAAVVLTLFTACSHTGAYNQAYLAAARKPDANLPGKVLVVTSPTADAASYTGSPTSFTGAATKITLPIGQIVRESAVAAFTDAFQGGASGVAAAPADSAGYAYVVSPQLVSFSYEYNQLKNAGFAVTPTAVVSLKVSVLGKDGAPRWSRDFDSGAVEGPAYMLNTSPQEEISKVVHRAIYETVLKAARTIAAEVPPAQP